ncbi:hypothetical protein [Methylocucumis oryzae]|uniref:SMODS and SLOG-associating 2TM effector domain-containing protein n=1 Tax=Methylocucumis oryzae TaxID=1632867 RepID=A0A0F3IGS9_9GAMM|nr:hypothetical protein [Methylocucumis oryzae]KJV05907.1 hypothetical protein VZ94_14795 [Methylocucumis oryzae]
MQKQKIQVISEIRYAIRLCQRTARLYRNIQTTGTFLTIVGGSATITALAKNLPDDIAIIGTGLLALAGAALIAIRPADKAAANENDVKRYQAILAKSAAMSVDELQQAVEEAHISDAPEIEAMRSIAYNDVVKELNRLDCIEKLSFFQSILAKIA